MPFPSPRPALPAAASALSSAVVRGPVRDAVVLGAHRLGLYLDVDGSVLPVVPSDAVALPTALRLGARSSALPDSAVPWGVVAGDRVPVGDGRVVLPVGDVVAVRTWRPARVRRVAAGASCPGSREDVAALLLDATAGCDPWLAPATAAFLEATHSSAPAPAPTPSCGECGNGRQDDHVRTHGEEEDAVAPLDGLAGLVGRGRGLTPSGDDALAGALLVAHALRTSRPLVTAVRPRLGRTTAVSAALLAAATDGFAARAVVALVDAVVLGHVRATARALPEVVAIGDTSGRDLVTGVYVALRALTPAATTTTTTQTRTPTGRSAA